MILVHIQKMYNIFRKLVGVLRAQCGENVVGRRKSGPTVYRATSGRLA